MDLTYHVRKSWDDSSSQVGIDYKFLINAQKACDKLEGYFVFNSDGIQVYPEQEEKISLMEVGAEVEIVPGACYVDGTPVHQEYIGDKMVIKRIEGDAYVLSKTKRAPAIKAIKADYVVPYSEEPLAAIDPFYVSVTADETFIKLTPNSKAKNIDKAVKYSFYKIINEKDNWGKLEKGAGWINLNDVIRL
jgi:hypothetical protein